MEKSRKTRRVVLAVSICFIAVYVVFTACNKNKNSQKVLNITGINDEKSELVNMKFKSQKSAGQQAFSIACYLMSSTTFDAKNKTFGYMDCHSAYRLIDIETGREIKQIPLPEAISLAVVDTIRNLLIGQYYIDGEEKDDGIDHVITVNLNDGCIVSDKPFYVGGIWDASVHFFRDIENEYVLMRYDWQTKNHELVFINPATGNIIRTLSLETEAGNAVYDRKNNRLIGTNYSNETGKNYIVTVNLSTGKTLSNVVAEGLGMYSSDEMDYDAETDSYILVSANNEVLFFDVATGKIKERHQMDFDITSLKLWRSDK